MCLEVRAMWEKTNFTESELDWLVQTKIFFVESIDACDILKIKLSKIQHPTSMYME